MMPLVNQYVTLLSVPTCYVKLPLHLLQISDTAVKVDLTCGGVQVLALFLRSRLCSLRMLGQDLLFLVSLSPSHQPCPISLYKLTDALQKKFLLPFQSLYHVHIRQSDFTVHSLQRPLVF